VTRPRWAEWVPLALPVGLALLVFARVVELPFVNWDDPSHFLDSPLATHPLARGLRGLFLTREIGYPAPVLLLSFALDRALWGVHAGPYHAENLALHIANVAMLYRIARRLRLSAVEACAVATLLAIHPLVVEPVCWVTGRKDLLSTALVLAAALLAAGTPSRPETTPPWRWLLANLALVLAVLVLPRAVVGPLLVAILVHGVRRDWSARAIALRLAPALAIAVVVVAVGASQIAELGALPPARSPGGVLADVAGAWALQLSHLLLPVDLLAYYFRVPGDPSVGAMGAATLAAVAALAATARWAPRGSVTRTGALLALVAYAPVSGLFVIRRWTADSYMYVPIAAIGLAVVPAVARVFPTSLARFGRSAALALAGLLALLSFAGTSRWSSSDRVWAGSIARYPDQPLAYEHEALGLRAAGRTTEANALFLRIAERFPDWPDTLDDEVRAYEAAGQLARATEVLAHGVRVGSAACLRMYWLRLLASPTPPDPGDRELVATAFRNGFPAMKDGLHDASGFRRVAAILRSLGLGDEAAAADAHADELERR
jgi:hypothetical protein